jgi:hypothetical protein
MVLADVDVPEPVPDLAYRTDQVVLLDVHVIGVEVNEDVPLTDVIGKAQAVACDVDDVRLVPVADLESEGHVPGLCLLGELSQHGDDVAAPRSAQRPVVLAEGAVQGPGEMGTAEPGGDVQRLVEQRLPTLDDVDVLAGDVGVEGEPTGACNREPSLLDLSPGSIDVQVVRVVQGDLEQVVAGRPSLGDGEFDRLRGRVADPDEGVNAEEVADRGDRHVISR